MIDTITVVDIETDGLYATDATLSVAMLDVIFNRETGRVMDFVNGEYFLINHPNLERLNVKAQAVHGLTIEEIKTKGLSVEEAATRVYKRLQRRPVTGWNSSQFDLPRLIRLASYGGYSLLIQEDLDLMKKAISKYGKKVSLKEAVSREGFSTDDVSLNTSIFFNEENTKSHNACYDVMAVGLLLPIYM